MAEQYAGILPENAPLYRFLACQVMEAVLGYRHTHPVFDVFHLDNSSTVFRFSDRRTFVSLVGKFYGNKWINGKQSGDEGLRAAYMQREFDNLTKLRALGLDTYPHKIVRPLAASVEHNCALVEEFVPGTEIDVYIRETVNWDRGAELRRKLTDLAWFLADLHTRSQTTTPVDQTRGLGYFDKIIDHLAYWKITSREQRQQLLRLRQRWRDSQILNSGQIVLTHGDPIFPHFLSHGEHGITSIDLERMWPGDRAMDLGCVVAELKHLFYLYSRDIWASEPYIRHFYESYFDYLPTSLEDFSTLTSRGRFYMGCYELRISRNDWLDLDYRHALLSEAETCLQI